MNKAELSDKIAAKAGITKAQAETALNSFTQITMETIKGGGEVVLTGFGTFSARARKGREGINPRNTSEKITIPTVLVVKFKAGKNLKDFLKGKEVKGME
jgi:DNA-binding protein HU-beta